jgi:hypothetical protein
MNKQRLRELFKIKTDLERLLGELESLSEEEQDAFDNLPESLQNADRGSEMEQNIEYLNEAAETLGQAIDSIENFDFDSLKSKKQLHEEAKIKLKELAKKLKEKLQGDDFE